MWTKEKTLLLYNLINKQKKTYSEVSRILNKGIDACFNKYKRTNWDLFLKTKDESLQGWPTKPWSVEELILLYKLRTKCKMSFLEIGKEMGRSLNSCEKKFQDWNWDELIQNRAAEKLQEQKEEQERLKSNSVQSLSNHIVNLSRHNVDILEEMSKSFFLEKSSLSENDLPIPFKEIKEKGKKILNGMGLCYPSSLELKQGTYIIVGDSHGKHTRRYMFDLIKNVSNTLKVKNIIHIGHMLDDDNDISYCWNDIKNLIVLAKREELQILSEKPFKFNIVRNEIRLGNLSVNNQDEITDYVDTYIGRLKKQVFPNTTVVNCHRHELDTRTTSGSTSQLISPGCICEPHVIRTIKQMNFEDGHPHIKLAYWDGFSKYRKMRHRYIYWEQGLLVVHVDNKGNFDVINCRIQRTSGGFTTSYFDKIITEKNVFTPHKKMFFNGDAHVQSHDEKILDLQEQFCLDYKPDTIVNIGDILDNRTLNSHVMKKAGWAINKSTLKEAAGVNFILKEMRKWGKYFYLLFGNHERFTKDFVEKIPQLKEILDFGFLINLDSLNIELTKHKEILRLNGVNFIHGDLQMFGAKGGNRLEKAAECIGKNTILGDCHYPSIRHGCFSVGISGKLEQGYNETSVTRWMHGLGYCNIFEDKCFITLVNIKDYSFSINNRKYTPKNPNKWVIPENIKASIIYD